MMWAMCNKVKVQCKITRWWCLVLGNPDVPVRRTEVGPGPGRDSADLNSDGADDEHHGHEMVTVWMARQLSTHCSFHHQRTTEMTSPNGLICFTNCLLPMEDGNLVEKDLWIDERTGIVLDSQVR